MNNKKENKLFEKIEKKQERERLRQGNEGKNPSDKKKQKIYIKFVTTTTTNIGERKKKRPEGNDLKRFGEIHQGHDFVNIIVNSRLV